MLRIFVAEKSIQRRPSIAAATERPEIIVPKSEVDQTAHQRPSRDFKRPERVNRTFSSATKLNSNTDANAKPADAQKEKPKKSAFRPASDYDYYDDGDVRVIGKANSKVKCHFSSPSIKLIHFAGRSFENIIAFAHTPAGEGNTARCRNH